MRGFASVGRAVRTRRPTSACSDGPLRCCSASALPSRVAGRAAEAPVRWAALESASKGAAWRLKRPSFPPVYSLPRLTARTEESGDPYPSPRTTIGSRSAVRGSIIQYLSDLRVYGNVLHVSYMAADGKQVEQFFKYNTFLARNGARLLADMASRVVSARAAIVSPSVWKAEVAPVQRPIRAELLDTSEAGWQRIAIYSALIAFPAICPVCARPADAIVAFRINAGLNQTGSWLIPACTAHETELPKYFVVGSWHASQSRIEFQVWNREYARQFLLVNTGENPEHVRRQADASPLLVAIKNGVRLIQFQYTVSALVLSMIIPSKIHVLQPRQRPFLVGLKYSLISAAAGWWSFVGLFWTPACIIRNCRGGTDLTKTVVAILSGSALSAGGYR